MSADNSEGRSPPESSGGLSLGLEWSSLLLATGTVCILPWLLGGVIPKAQLVLQVGTITAAVCTLLARLVSGRPFAAPPFGATLLLGMASIGLIQLQPWMPSAISQMNHAVHPEFRGQLPGSNSKSATAAISSRIPADSRSAAPALTRRHVAQWIAVALLLCVVADSMSRASQLSWVLGLLCMNASVMTILSLLQSFSGSRWLSESWMISQKSPFGSFVNQNNAAGWLLVHVTLAIGFGVVVWGNSSLTSRHDSFRRLTWQERTAEAASIVRQRIAALNSLQLISLVTVALLLTGVAATMSRGGIVAGIVCLLVCAASRTQIRRSFLLLLSLLLLLVCVSVFLTALELDTPILVELQTLKNPISEVKGRVLHWSDSLSSVRDFPLLGSGQGAYAWSTRPYLRHGNSMWFKNADNQYVEILVESGLLGISFLIGFGVWLTVASLKLIPGTSATRSGHELRTHSTGIGVAGLAMIASQAIAASCDFGIGHCSTIAAIAMFGGILTAVGRSQQASLPSASTWYSPNSAIVGWLIRITMVVAAGTAVPELRHLDQVYSAVVESENIRNSSVTRTALEQLPVLDQQLSAALEQYPDHPAVRRARLRIVEARFRLQVIDQLSAPGSRLDDRPLQDAWTQLTPLALADRIAAAKTNLTPENFNKLRGTVESTSRDFPWHEMARDISRQMPLEPKVAVLAAAGYSSIGQLDDHQLQELNAVRFTDPAGDRNLFLSGMLCLLEDRPKQSAEFWKRSLNVSERFRVPILLISLRFLSLEEALEQFAPEEYATTVRTALARSTPELEAGLLQRAQIQWLSVLNNPTREQRIQRAAHLLRRDSSDETMQWIERCLAEFPDLVELRPMRAKVLEDQGKLNEAIGEWMRYEHFEPGNRFSSRAIKRLNESKNE